MLSVLVSIHNSRDRVINLLSSLVRAFQGWPLGGVEFLLIDDNSDPKFQIPNVLAEFRSQLPPGVKCTDFLFNQHQHYTRALAYGFSAAKGNQVLFVSHDMMMTSDYVRTLLAVSAMDSSIGLVRGVSPYVDCFPQHVVVPPFQLRNYEDLDVFSRYVSEYWGFNFVEDRMLTGDSMLVTRAALDKIGTFDPRYVGYFGDIDFGLRLQRAGMKMVCAKGAWLWHEGAGAYRDKAEQTQQAMAEIHRARMEVVNQAYLAFRDKWDKSMPPDYISADALPLEALRTAPTPAGGDFQPFIQPDPAICTVR